MNLMLNWVSALPIDRQMALVLSLAGPDEHVLNPMTLSDGAFVAIWLTEISTNHCTTSRRHAEIPVLPLPRPENLINEIDKRIGSQAGYLFRLMSGLEVVVRHSPNEACARYATELLFNLGLRFNVVFYLVCPTEARAGQDAQAHPLTKHPELVAKWTEAALARFSSNPKS